MTRLRLHFHHSLYKWWGVPARYVQLVSHLDPDRFACSITATPDVPDPEGMPNWQARMAALVEPDLKRQGGPWHSFNDLRAEAATRDLCAMGGVDIVHFLDGEHSGPWLPRLFRNRLAGIKSVATFHQPPALSAQVTPGAALRHLDAIVLMSPSQLPYFAPHVQADRLHVLLHGVDTGFFTPRTVPRTDGPLHCITTGLHLRDWDAFHAVARALPEMCFTVVTSSRVALQALPNVVVQSSLKDAALADAYRTADVLFLPLQDATANNSLLEGMASGLPVVSTEHEAVRAYVPNEAGLLVKGNAVQGLIAALTRLATDPALRDRLGKAARARARELDWSQAVRGYASLYESLASQPGMPATLPPRPIPSMPPHAAKVRSVRAVPSISIPSGDAFAPLALWSEALHRIGLGTESGMICDALAATQPAWPETQFAFAAAAEAAGRWQDAADHWDCVLRTGTERHLGQGLARKALALANAGAITDALRTLERDTERFETRLAKARIADAFLSPDQALTAWQACVTRHPDQIDGFLGLARHHLHQARLDAAEDLANHLFKVWPEVAEAAALWASCADARGDLPEAMRRWTQVLKQHPVRAVLQPYARHLGLKADTTACAGLVADTRQDDPSGAEVMFHFHAPSAGWWQAANHSRRAVERVPGDWALRLRHANLLLQLGSVEACAEALALLRDLYRIAPEATRTLTAFAKALIAAGNDQEAREVISLIPADRTDLQAEVLREWTRLDAEGNTSALRLWRALFVDFGIASPQL